MPSNVPSATEPDNWVESPPQDGAGGSSAPYLPLPTFELLETPEGEEDGHSLNAVVCQSDGFPDVVILLHPDVALNDAIELTELLRERVCGFCLRWRAPGSN
jgi:hypothetical protein